MYEKKDVSINWFKIGVRILVVILAAILLFKIVVIVKDNKTNVVEEDKMQKKLDLLEESGKKYFTEDLIPKEVGKSVTITLGELIDANLSKKIKDNDNKACDNKKSYVKVTRLDNEYQIKSYLKCDNYEDYKNSFVKIKSEDNKTTTTKTKTTKTTTKKVTTTRVTTTKIKKTYTISFNTNGGELMNDLKVVENGVVGGLKRPVRDGYRFIGWYYHGTPFDIDTKINKDYVLVAKWILE